MTRCPVAIGEVIADKYRVERVLGEGGMGVVVAATHVLLGQQVALKFLIGPARESPEARTRFLREARAAVRIQSDHVARILDVGALGDGSPYIVMEYLEGGDLASVLERSGPMPVEQAASYVMQACSALAEAHALGVVHRDIKPSNLFLARRADGSQRIKVVDFGIAKELVGGALTATGSAMGTPLYMSPEQIKSPKGVDARTDVWSLGAVLYELLTGAAPFMAETAPQLFLMIATQPAPRVRELRPSVSPELERVVARALEKEPAARYASVVELGEALAPFAALPARASRAIIPALEDTGDEPTQLMSTMAWRANPTVPGAPVAVHAPAAAPVTPALAGAVQTQGGFGSTAAAPPPRRSRWRPAVAAACAVSVAGVAGVLVLNRASERASVAAEPPVQQGAAAGSQASESAAPLAVSTQPAIPPAPAASDPAPAASAPTTAIGGKRGAAPPSPHAPPAGSAKKVQPPEAAPHAPAAPPSPPAPRPETGAPAW